jgi:hypothetical protein
MPRVTTSMLRATAWRGVTGHRACCGPVLHRPCGMSASRFHAIRILPNFNTILKGKVNSLRSEAVGDTPIHKGDDPWAEAAKDDEMADSPNREASDPSTDPSTESAAPLAEALEQGVMIDRDSSTKTTVQVATQLADDPWAEAAQAAIELDDGPSLLENP